MHPQPKFDLSRRLRKKQQQRQFQLSLIMAGGFFLASWLLFVALFGLPWHWQLFWRWLTRGGDVTSIPEHLHQELRNLCYAAAPHGQVDGYGASPEIAYGLGKFQCWRSTSGDFWLIRDKYGFSNPGEAAGGTPLAEILVALWGTDYSYEIKSAIPILNPPSAERL